MHRLAQREVLLAHAHRHPKPFRLALFDAHRPFGFDTGLAQTPDERSFRRGDLDTLPGRTRHHVMTIDAGLPEHVGGAGNERFGDRGHGDVDAFGPERGDTTIGNAARHDVGEHAEVARHVERHAVQRAPGSWHPANRADTDGGDLAR